MIELLAENCTSGNAMVVLPSTFGPHNAETVQDRSNRTWGHQSNAYHELNITIVFEQTYDPTRDRQYQGC